MKRLIYSLLLLLAVAYPTQAATKMKMFGSRTCSTPATTGTRYYHLMAANADQATDYTAIMPTSGTFRKLYVYTSAAPGADNSWTFTLRVDAADSTLTCQIAGASATSCNDTAHDVAVTGATNRVSIKGVGVGTSAATTMSFVVEFEGTTASETVLLGNSAGNLTAATPTYGIPGGMAATAAAESWAWTVMPCAGTLKSFTVRLVTAPGNTDATRTFTVRQNGADSTLVVSYATAENLIKQDSVNTVAVAAGDRIAIASAYGATTPAASGASWGIVFVPTTSGQFVIPTNASAANLSTSADRYIPLASSYFTPVAVASEANTYNVGWSDTYIKGASGCASVAPGAGKTYTTTLRKDGGDASTTFAVVMTGASAPACANASAGSLALVDASYYDTEVTPAGTPTASKVYLSYIGYIADDSGAGAARGAKTLIMFGIGDR